jgi:hypothetical protein
VNAARARSNVATVKPFQILRKVGICHMTCTCICTVVVGKQTGAAADMANPRLPGAWIHVMLELFPLM